MADAKPLDLQLTKTLKDAAYVTVGLGVLAVQKAQVSRRELTKQVESQLSGTTEHLQKVARQFEERVSPLFDQIEEALPDAARDLVKQARTAARDVQDQLLGRPAKRPSRAAA
jgi:soluble cytochrome b562